MKKNENEILEYLFSQRDEQYAKFQEKLCPTVTPEMIIGVRTPILRKYAKALVKDESKRELRESFLKQLPHKYFDEYQLHIFILSLEKDYETCISQVEEILPFIDNWATCDQLSPKVFKKHLAELLDRIDIWIASEHTYTIRFGIGMLMQFYLDENFDISYAKRVAGVRSDEYYVNMEIAWYFATALAKHYHSILPFIENKELDDWTHNKTIQKAVESYRITPEQKEYLRTLKVKKVKA